MKHQFHPSEIAVCGPSGSGKTTLLEKLCQRLAGRFRIGYVKSDAHGFTMDYPLKDTYRLKAQGATTVFIHDAQKSALIQDGLPILAVKTALLDCDMVLIEGGSDLDCPKLAFPGKGEPKGKVLAWLGEITHDRQTPFLHRDDLEGIERFILDDLASRQRAPLYGLVLAGGQSKRMGQDKANLPYNGKKQLQRIAEIFDALNMSFFISCKKEQSEESLRASFAQIHDVLDRGPAGGILSAMLAYPEHAFLVLACDLPLFGVDDAKNLIQNRNPHKTATAYHDEKGLPEPLCAIWEPKAKALLMTALGQDITCPRKMLLQTSVATLPPQSFYAIANVNDPTEYQIHASH